MAKILFGTEIPEYVTLKGTHPFGSLRSSKEDSLIVALITQCLNRATSNPFIVSLSVQQARPNCQ